MDGIFECYGRDLTCSRCLNLGDEVRCYFVVAENGEGVSSVKLCERGDRASCLGSGR